MTLRVGVLGAARIVPKSLLGPARGREDVEVVAVASRGLERARRYADEHGIPGAFGDYAELLASADVDAVYVATPNSLHGRWTLAALAAGKHVLCEKPFTANAAEARVVAAAARRSGLVVMEAFHNRYHPATARMVAVVSSGELGPVREYAVRFGTPLGADATNIRWRLDLAGGAVMDIGCYALQLLRTLACDEPTVVGATAGEYAPGVDGDMDIVLELPGGARATVGVTMRAEGTDRTMSLTVEGDRGVMTATRPFIPQEGNEIVVVANGRVRREVTDPRSSYEFQLAAFADAVLRGGPVLTDADEAVKTMELVDAAYLAAGLPLRMPAA